MLAFEARVARNYANSYGYTPLTQKVYCFDMAKQGPLNTWPLKDAVRAAFLPSSNYSFLHTSDLGDDVGNSL